MLNIIVYLFLLTSVNGQDGIKGGSNHPHPHPIHPIDTKSEENIYENRVADAISRFAFLYLNNVGQSSNNIVYSPFSLQVLLSMIYAGTANDTRAELRATLGFDMIGLNDEQIHFTLKSLLNQINGDRKRNDNKYQLDMANLLLIQKGFKVQKSYRNDLHMYYNADIKDIDFQMYPVEVMNSINKWVHQNTNGRISSTLDDPLSVNTKLFALNSIYFNGTWKYKFDKQLTRDLPFFVDGKTESAKLVPFMSQTLVIPYASIPEMQMKVIELPYAGKSDVSMLILLPYDRDGISRLMRSLTASSLRSIYPRLEKEEVILHLPIFHLEQSYDLRLVLQRLGVTRLFDESKADLTGIDGVGNLYVSKALHKAVIDVNEEGTQASGISAAATSVRTSIPNHEYFNADHPFIFLLKRGGTILFVGRVSHP